MTLLKKNYVGWQFDTKDEIQVKLWYSAFKNLTDEQFESLVKDYIANNEYPPKCIKNLTDIYVDRQIQYAVVPPEKALALVREIVTDCGGWEYGKRDIYAKLRRYPTLYDTVKEFESELRNLRVDDTYTADRFRKAYEVKLRTGAIRQVDTALGLNIPDNSKLLGSGFLPSEI